MFRTPEDHLHSAWHNGTLIPFVGAGVSISAAKLPNWQGVLEAGIEYVRACRADLGVSDEEIERLNGDSPDGLLHSFNTLQELTTRSEDHYQAFLIDQFGRPEVTDVETLEALRLLRPRFVVTTNYDTLLEQHRVAATPTSATWHQQEDILSVVRGAGGVIHLHGRWDQPDSVILSGRDYNSIVKKGGLKTISSALFNAGVLVFIGCSIDNTQDPHLSRILGQFKRLNGPLLDKSHPHLMLVKGQPTAMEEASLRRMGIVPISYGERYGDLPRYLRRISATREPQVSADRVRTVLSSARRSKNLREALENVRSFIDDEVYPGLRTRIAFARKTEREGRTFLENRHVLPPGATHNTFSYPQTLAAWALVEGRILSWPGDEKTACDFDRLRKLGKYDRIRAALLETSGESDPLLGHFLDDRSIRQKTEEETLTLEDLYQNRVREQTVRHYGQFLSLPVPVVKKISKVDRPDEIGVFNIDTEEDQPALLNEDTQPLLELASEMAAACFVMHPED